MCVCSNLCILIGHIPGSQLVIPRTIRYQDRWKRFLPASRSSLNPPGPSGKAKNLSFRTRKFTENIMGKSEVGGVSQFVKPPTGKSFRFVRACERARRGEAVWASERRFDCAARAVVRAVYVLFCSSSGKNMPGGLSTKNVDFTQVFSGFSRTTFVKPM